MTLSYGARLLLLSSASFFWLQLLIGALIAFIAPAAIRRAGTMRPQHAAQMLFALRLLPTALSTLAVFALCVPSYLRFEPRVAQEEVGVACAAAALFGACLCALAIFKTLSALIRSALYVRQCGGREASLEGETVWIVRESAGLALAGIVHPRLLISERAMSGLSSDQLAVALRHERAHRVSRDNLKRLLFLLAPAIFPALRRLEQAWVQCSEWSADDCAAEGDADRSLTLAAALVQVARLQSGLGPQPLVTSLVEADEDLSLRVDRLLHAAPVREVNPRAEVLVAMFGAATIAAIAVNPVTLRIVHQLLEKLLD